MASVWGSKSSGSGLPGPFSTANQSSAVTAGPGSGVGEGSAVGSAETLCACEGAGISSDALFCSASLPNIKNAIRTAAASTITPRAMTQPFPPPEPPFPGAEPSSADQRTFCAGSEGCTEPCSILFSSSGVKYFISCGMFYPLRTVFRPFAYASSRSSFARR